MSDDLVELARRALAAKLAPEPETDPQVAFLEALARRVTSADGFKAPEEIFRSPRLMILSDGKLGADEPLASLVARGATTTLETITARMAAIAPTDAEVQEAAKIVADERPPVFPVAE
jgi:hypothetical protein